MQPAVQAVDPEPDMEQVERYAHFPVTAEEEQQLAMVDTAAATPAATAAAAETPTY